MEFKNERERQAYWKKKRLQDLAIDDKNSSQLTKAYHNVSFDIVPPVKDNRTLKEIQDDALGQAMLAKQNAMILMANDGTEADKLLSLIGKNNYVAFNTNAISIIEQMKSKIGRMLAPQMYQEIELYRLMQENIEYRIPPNAAQLDDLIATITNNFNVRDKQVIDILQKLDAYKNVLSLDDISEISGNLVPLSADEVDSASGDNVSQLSARLSGITQNSLQQIVNQAGAQGGDAESKSNSGSVAGAAAGAAGSVAGDSDDDGTASVIAPTEVTTESIKGLREKYKDDFINESDMYGLFEYIRDLTDSNNYYKDITDKDDKKEFIGDIRKILRVVGDGIGVNNPSIDTAVAAFRRNKERLEQFFRAYGRAENRGDEMRGQDYLQKLNGALRIMESMVKAEEREANGRGRRVKNLPVQYIQYLDDIQSATKSTKEIGSKYKFVKSIAVGGSNSGKNPSLANMKAEINTRLYRDVADAIIDAYQIDPNDIIAAMAKTPRKSLLDDGDYGADAADYDMLNKLYGNQGDPNSSNLAINVPTGGDPTNTMQSATPPSSPIGGSGFIRTIRRKPRFGYGAM